MTTTNTTRMRRPLLATALVAATALTAPPVTAATHRVRMWRVEPARPGAAAVLDMKVTVTSTGTRYLAVVVGIHGVGAKRTSTDGVFIEGGSPYPIIYGVNGADYNPCPAAPGCDSTGGQTAELPFTSDGKAIRDQYLVVTDNATAAVTFHTAGWRVREITPTTVRRILAEDTTATGVNAQGQTIENYHGAAAAGGRYGSFAWAFLPCENAGHGTAELVATPRTAAAPGSMHCGGITLGGSATALANVAVTWHVTVEDNGSIGASSEHGTRLLVIDLPR